jgi:hypothetical protein
VSGRDYASVPERITWTTGFRVPTDKLVLCALSTFANFQTGEGAQPAIATLAARAGLSRSTVQRALHRLEVDQWIAVTARRHRRPTTYRICVERLAENWVGAKVVKRLRVTGDAQEPVENVLKSDSLRVTGDSLRVTGDAQEPVLSVTGDAPSPVRTDPLYGSPVRREEPSLRAGVHYAGTTTKSAEAKGQPYQQTFGPLDVSAEDEKTAQWKAHWTRMKEITASALNQKRDRKQG